MFHTPKDSFQMEDAKQGLVPSLLRWGGGVVIAALEFQAIYSLIGVWE